MIRQAGTSAVAAEERITFYHWQMFVICFLGNIMGGTTSTLMSVYLPDLSKDLSETIDAEQVGAYITALYFIGWAVGGLVWGFLGDLIGRVRALAFSVAMFGLFTLLIGFTASWELIVIFRFLSGFGVGGMLVINTTLLSEAWPEKTRAIFIGILSIGFPVGIFSSGAVNYFVSGWQEGFMVGLIPLVIGMASFFVLEESRSWKGARTHNPVAENLGDHRIVIINGCIVFGAMLIGLWAVFSWIPTWVQSLLGGGDGQRERSVTMMLFGIGVFRVDSFQAGYPTRLAFADR